MFFASLWDCFLLFCEHKENTGKEKKKGSCGFFGGSCQSIFIQNPKVKIVINR